MSTSSLRKLVENGANDIFLTSTPEVTCFKAVYRRCTMFKPNKIAFSDIFINRKTINTEQTYIKVKNILDLDFDIHSKCASCKKYLIERDMDCFLFYRCENCNNFVHSVCKGVCMNCNCTPNLTNAYDIKHVFSEIDFLDKDSYEIHIEI